MAKIYQAFYSDSEGNIRHHGASLTGVEKEARLTAKEKGVTVKVDVLEVEKPSLKSIIQMLNGGIPLSRVRISTFVPSMAYTVHDEDGDGIRRWKVERLTPDGVDR